MLIKLPEDYSWFDINKILDYLKHTTEESWCTEVVKTHNGQSSLFGHIFDWAGGDDNIKKSNQAMDLFESCFATTCMVYPVNDGKNEIYNQPTPKQRCIAYVEDLMSGKQKTTYELMNEYANQ